MHESIQAFVASYELTGPTLEVGSLYVNGGVRDLCPEPYTGIDIVDGPGVDQVYDGHQIPFPDGQFSTVICVEVFEHCENPCELAAELVRVLAPGGVALVSARGPGFPLHHEPDRWRYMPGALAELFSRHGCVTAEMPDPQEGHPGSLVHAVKLA